MSYRLYPEKAQRRLRLIPTRTLNDSYSNEYSLEMHAHIGTHVEGPYHCLRDGKTIDEIPPDKFIGYAAIIDLSEKSKRRIDRKDLEKQGAHIEEGDIVLLKTGYDDEFDTEDMQSEEYKSQSPFLTDQAIEYLIKERIKLLGIDFWSIEEHPIDPKVGEPRHIMLFRHEIPLVHSLINLTELKTDRVFFVALPLPVNGLDSSPVRAVALELG